MLRKRSPDRAWLRDALRNKCPPSPFPKPPQRKGVLIALSKPLFSVSKLSRFQLLRVQKPLGGGGAPL